MSISKSTQSIRSWNVFEKIAFRIAFIFFLILCIPTSTKWYDFLFHLDWTNLHCRDIYNITNFSPNFIKGTEARYGLSGYINWGVVFVIALLGGLVWTFIDSKRKQPAREYNVLYYWLRVIVRYRTAIGIIGFGFLKLFPAQMPYPSLGVLNTNFGDMTQQKVYWLSIGIVPWYQTFGGFVEILAGVLLLFRGTVAFGSALLIGALGAITVVNLAYDNTLHVYASYFALAGAFLLAHDIPKIYNLLILERYTTPFHFYPSFSRKWQQYSRAGLKVATFAIFIFLFGYLEYINFIYDPYKQPSVKGVSQLRGNYNVTEFRLNNKLIPYSPHDSLRWQELTFEKWTSLSYKVNQAAEIDLSNGGGNPMRDINRTFELAGVAGGRRVFHYYADTLNQMLYLQDKNLPNARNSNRGATGILDLDKKKENMDTIYPENWISKEALANIGDEVYKINKRAVSTTRIRAFATEPEIRTRKKMILKYRIIDENRVILSGTNERRDSVYIVLDKVNREYSISPSKLVAGKY